MATKTDSNGNIVTFELDTKNTYVGETMAFNINVTTGGLDTSDATAIAEDIIQNKTAYVNGEQITGSRRPFSYSAGTGNIILTDFMFEKNSSITGNDAGGSPTGHGVLTVPVEQNFYIDAGESLKVPIYVGIATTDQVLSGVTFTSVSGNSLTGTIPSKDAETYIPGTSDQTIAASQYLAGVQTIKGDANLVAENIAKDVTIFGITGTHQGGTTSGGTDTSDATATSADILSGKTAYVNGVKITGGYSTAVATATATTSRDSTSLSFTVSGRPIAWSVVQTANTRDWGNTRFICACNSEGNSTSMTTESNYGRQYAYSNYISATYESDLSTNKNTLTVSTSNSSNTGTFRGGIAYQLLYVYASVVEPEQEPDLPDGEVGYISTNNVISLSDTKLPAGTYTLYYEDENENKLEGWSAIGSISKGGVIE